MGISMNSGCQGLGSMAALCEDLQYGEKQVDRQQAALLKLSQTVENTGCRERSSEQASGPCGNLSHCQDLVTQSGLVLAALRGHRSSGDTSMDMGGLPGSFTLHDPQFFVIRQNSPSRAAINCNNRQIIRNRTQGWQVATPLSTTFEEIRRTRMIC
jgi:hypothetical protein